MSNGVQGRHIALTVSLSLSLSLSLPHSLLPFLPSSLPAPSLHLSLTLRGGTSR